MFAAYTQMAGHHNPRADKTARVRQRFMHKLCFFEERYGKSLCVGCGRCLEMCPVALDITCLIDQIAALDVENSGAEPKAAVAASPATTTATAPADPAGPSGTTAVAASPASPTAPVKTGAADASR
jgi:ferredoxin